LLNEPASTSPIDFSDLFLRNLLIGFKEDMKLRFFFAEIVEEAIVDSLLVDIFTNFMLL